MGDRLPFFDRSGADERTAHLDVLEAHKVILYGDQRALDKIGQYFFALEDVGIPIVKVYRVSETPLPKRSEEQSTERLKDESKAKGGAVVEPSWLRSRLGKPALEVLDIREGWGPDYTPPPAYAAGQVPGSIPFEPRTAWDDAYWPEQAQIRDRFAELGPRARDKVDLDALFVLVAESDDADAGLAYFLARLAGLRVRMLEGGWDGWQADKRNPIVRMVEADNVRRFLVREPTSWKRDAITEKVILLDLRERWDFKARHLPGAVPLPSSDFQEGFLALKERQWPHLSEDAPLIFYCYGRECIRSRKCAAWAAQMGFNNLLWFRDGLDGWVDAGQPVFKGLRKNRDGL